MQIIVPRRRRRPAGARAGVLPVPGADRPVARDAVGGRRAAAGGGSWPSRADSFFTSRSARRAAARPVPGSPGPARWGSGSRGSCSSSGCSPLLVRATAGGHHDRTTLWPGAAAPGSRGGRRLRGGGPLLPRHPRPLRAGGDRQRRRGAVVILQAGRATLELANGRSTGSGLGGAHKRGRHLPICGGQSPGSSAAQAPLGASLWSSLEPVMVALLGSGGWRCSTIRGLRLAASAAP